jgi:uroporphyrinogen decarboxylase
MTNRDLYLNTLLFSNPEKIPFEPGGPRKSTIERWQNEGLPKDVSWWDYVVCDKLNITLPQSKPISSFWPDFRMIPWFEEKVLEHKDGHYIIQDWMGAILEISDKYDYTYIRNAIDFVTRKWIKCPVETREDWQEMKRRYDPDTPQRVKEFTPKEVKQINGRDRFLSVSVNGPFWQLREWLGFESLCIAFLDQPDFVAEMIEFWQDYVLRIFERIFSQGIILDGVNLSEDMAYKAHSMISPAMTREYLLPVYKKWVSYFKANGVKIIDMDSDGCIAELIPIWIDAGINVCDPIEVAAHNDIILYRELFGEKMAYKGGVDKRAIAAGGKVIEDELKKISPLINNRGGFIPSCDHGVPHDISLENFIYYSKLLAEYTGWL